jgi:hypothetical protein
LLESSFSWDSRAVLDFLRFRPLSAILLAPCAILVSGCWANLPAISARLINCNEEEVEIPDQHLAINDSSWIATCRGRSYQCRGADSLITCQPIGGYGETRGMVLPPPPPPPPMR